MRVQQKTIQHHVGGRKRPDFAKLATHHRMGKYMALSQLPAPPASFNYWPLANQAAVVDILGNGGDPVVIPGVGPVGPLGDCTAAGACHLADVYSAGGGAPAAMTAAQAIAFYSLSTGYNPADPSTDQGGDEVTVLTTWQQKGLDGNGLHPIKGFVLVDGANAPLLFASCWLLGGLYFGLELTEAMANTSGPGYLWVPGTANPADGHCVVGAGGDSSGKGQININTWGLLGGFEMDAIAELCVESAGGTVFVPISQEWVNAAKAMAPSGFDWEQLASDFDLDLGGTVPVPPPTPAPPAPLPPGGAATLASAQAAMVPAFGSAFVFDRAQAIAAGQAAVASLTWPTS
jgi:hypothetical protein